MIKKEIHFKDFDENDVVETHYFHLSKARIVELENDKHDGRGTLSQRLNAVSSGQMDGALIMKTIKDFVSDSYGLRGGDSKFVQSKEISDEFLSSFAFDTLFNELVSDADRAGQFMFSVMPKDLLAAVGVTTPDQLVSLPDPNGLDTNGVWPRAIPTVQDTKPDDTKAWPTDNGEQPPDEASYLTNPRDKDGNLYPWAFREPTNAEVRAMNNNQLVDLFQRKNTDFQAFEFKK